MAWDLHALIHVMPCLLIFGLRQMILIIDVKKRREYYLKARVSMRLMLRVVDVKSVKFVA